MSYKIKIVKEQKKEEPLHVHYSLNLVILGDTGVGKTSLLNKLTGKDSGAANTIGLDFFTVTLPLKIPFAEHNEIPRACIHITDTSGEERFKSFTVDSLKKCPVAIIMYDCQNKATFGDEGSRVIKYYEDVKQKNSWAHVMVVLMAGKADSTGEVQVPHPYAYEFAQKRGWLFMKFSDKGTNTNQVEDKFSRIATAALERCWGERKLEELWEPFIDPPHVIYKYISG